jgi:hypothetical protein
MRPKTAQSEDSEQKLANVVVPRGPDRNDKLSEENQNKQKTRGCCPTSRPCLSFPNGPARESRNGSHVNLKYWPNK